MGGQLATGSSIYMASAGVPAADGAGLSSIKSFSQLLTSIAALPLAGGTLTGNLLFTDNTYTIGAAGATRPSAVHVGTGGVTSAGIVTGTSQAQFTSGFCAKGTSLDNNWGGGIDFTSNSGSVYGYIRSDNVQLYQTATSFSAGITVTTTIGLGAYTVATLPSAASNAGKEAQVTDSNAAASGNYGATVAGGGSNRVKVFSDGTNWVIA